MTQREHDDRQSATACERCGHSESDHDNGLLCRVLYCRCRVFARARRDNPRGAIPDTVDPRGPKGK